MKNFRLVLPTIDIPNDDHNNVDAPQGCKLSQSMKLSSSNRRIVFTPFEITFLLFRIHGLERVTMASDEHQLGPMYMNPGVQNQLWALRL